MAIALALLVRRDARPQDYFSVGNFNMREHSGLLSPEIEVISRRMENIGQIYRLTAAWFDR